MMTLCHIINSILTSSKLVGSYYNVIIAWCLFYFLSSLQATLPWSSCPQVTTLVEDNVTQVSVVAECEMSSETQYFWFRSTLDSSNDIGKKDLW